MGEERTRSLVAAMDFANGKNHMMVAFKDIVRAMNAIVQIQPTKII